MRLLHKVANRKSGIVHAGVLSEKYDGVLETFCGMEITANRIDSPCENEIPRQFMWADNNPVDCKKCKASLRSIKKMIDENFANRMAVEKNEESNTN